jgi:alanine racemase
MNTERRAWAEVDLGAIAHNVTVLHRAAPGAALCAVVKANGYGHGAVPVAQAALSAGATWLAVAQAPEAIPLRAAGIDAPILVLSEPPPGEWDEVVDLDLDTVVFTPAGMAGLGDLAVRRGREVRAHLKVDTGMQRAGVPLDQAVAVGVAVERHPGLDLVGLMTHFAAADDLAHPATGRQLERFAAVAADLAAAGVEPPLRHAANSAGLLTRPDARFDLVRAGIALYGIAPDPSLATLPPVTELRPALRLAARVSRVARVEAGSAVSYGLRHSFGGDTTVATVPIGYADGVRRSLGLAGAPVLIGGRRHPMVGVVTMDQLMVDVGPDAAVAEGDEAVLIGAQGEERIAVDELAELAGTISYELCTALGDRLERRYRPGPSPRADTARADTALG